jgi:signal transduction histidine kinase
MTFLLGRFLFRVSCLALAAGSGLHAEPILLKSAEATFHSRDPSELMRVIDGVPIGPEGWSVAPNLDQPQAMIFRCAEPVEVAELDVTLYFLSGRPNNSIAEFSLSYTTDEEPSLEGNWKPLKILRFTAEVATLQRTDQGHLRAAMLPNVMTGKIPDDIYRIAVHSPESSATGFRLDVFPVFAYKDAPPWMSWGTPHDFVLTEFRVEEDTREATNIALHCPVRASHPLFQGMKPGALTDGLPATIAHPSDETPIPDFYYEVDLGRVAAFDHLGLRTRADGYLNRFSRIIVRIYEADPQTGAPPAWEGMIRADGSHPPAGTADIVRAAQGKGVFRGRYLRLSSDSKIPLSPQLAEVEVYEPRTPEVIEALADGREIPLPGSIELPPGIRRLSLRLRIPQMGRPPGNTFRWRLRGDLEEWQMARLMFLDMPCPPPGKTTVFEAQALHSDNQWDATVFSLPIISRQHFWENRWFQGILAILLLGFSMWVARARTRRRAARQLAAMKARASLAEERARIARDLHDDLGANLAEIAMISELAREALPADDPTRAPLDKIFTRAEGNTRRLGEIVWAVNPSNDTLEHFTKYLCKFAQDYLSLAGVRCRFQIPGIMPPGYFSAAQRYNLLLAAKETIHNAVKHGDPGTVNLHLGMCDGRFVVTIQDDGCGFDEASAPASTRGCANMRLRMETIGGIFHITSCPGKGTTVTLQAPFTS